MHHDTDTDNDLEPSADNMRAMVHASLERIITHLSELQQSAPVQYGGEALATSLRDYTIPEVGKGIEAALSILFDEALETTFNTAHPGYLAYIPGGGIFTSALADLISSSINRYVGVFAAAPGLVQLEQNVIRWFCSLVGFGAQQTTPGGFLTTGGSYANLSAIITARREKLGDDFSQGVLYASKQAHHSIQKAAMLAGFRNDQMRFIDTDEKFCMQASEIERAIEQDLEKDLRPFLICANAGTTNTGAIDALKDIAALAKKHDCFMHTDAAYGGFFTLTERGKQKLSGIELSDTVTLDPHKGLFLPYGNGCLLAKDKDALKRAHKVTADYMPEMQEHDEQVDFCDISPELSRDFRGLRVWLPMMLHGAQAFRKTLDEKLDQCAWLFERVAQIKQVSIEAEPQLSVFAFRLKLEGKSEDELDALNEKLMKSINAKGRVYLTQTRLRGAFVIRCALLHFRTDSARVKMALEDIEQSVAAVLSSDHG